MALAVLCIGSAARADLTMAAAPPEGCPGATFFAREAERRALRGAATLSITRGDAEFVGTIWFLDGAGPQAREVRGPTCDSVADTLVLIAEVHERPASGPMPASAILSVPPPKPPPTVGAVGASAVVAPSEPAAPFPRARPDPPPHEPRVFSGGVGLLLDTAVVPGGALGGMIFGRYTPPASRIPTRGWATLSLGYLAGSVDVGDVHVSHRRWFGRITTVPYAWVLGRETRLGLGANLGLARLGVKADVPFARDDARPLVDVGVGPRILTVLGPLSAEAGVDLLLSVSRRRFVLPEREEPVFRLPVAAFAAFLAVGPR